jgi:hypothetical protein
VKSRETRQREARDWGLWLLGAVAALLALSVLVEETPLSGTAGLGPVIGASLGAGVAYMLTRRQRRQEDDQRRRALATGLLSEIRLLEPGLRDIHGDTTAAYQVMEPFQTAVYDQAGANLLLFRPATVHALNLFYNGVHELRTTLARSRIPYHDLRSLAQRYPPGDQEHIRIRLMATNVHDVIRDVATRLHQDEGGRWPDTLPPLRFRRVGGQLDVPELQPSIFEDRKCPPTETLPLPLLRRCPARLAVGGEAAGWRHAARPSFPGP